MTSHLFPPYPDGIQTPRNATRDRERFSRFTGRPSHSGTTYRTQEALLAAAAENQPLYPEPVRTTADTEITLMDSRSSLASRRRSVRDQKAPLGPRPPDFSPSKRHVPKVPSPHSGQFANMFVGSQAIHLHSQPRATHASIRQAQLANHS